MRRVRVSTLAAATLLALATASPDAALAAPDTPARKTPTPAPAPDPLAGALSERIAGKRSLDDVELDLIWRQDEARLYGTGVGICRNASQIRVPRAELLALLEELRQARFGGLPDRFGKVEDDEREDIEYLKGRLTVRVGSLSKSVTQMREGEQSPELANLATRILKICDAAAKTGVGAADLPDGLGKLASGKLSPEAFEALVQRREGRSASGAPENWILRIKGRQVIDRLMPAGRKPDPPKALTLSEKQFRDLAAFLASNDVAALPGSVYSAQYTDLRVKVLNRERVVSGRRLGGERAEAPGARQQAFDRIYDEMRRLHLEVQKSGKPDAGSVELRSEPESEKEGGAEREREKERERAERKKPATSPSPARP
jgi:hypothetical protein